MVDIPYLGFLMHISTFLMSADSYPVGTSLYFQSSQNPLTYIHNGSRVKL